MTKRVTGPYGRPDKRIGPHSRRRQVAGVRVTAAGRRLGVAVERGSDAIELEPLRPSAAIRAAYQARLYALVDEMHRSISYWLTAAYRANTPEIAQDASPARELRAALRKLARRWQGKFDALAPQLAEYFARDVSQRVDGELERMFRKAGFTVKFKLTKAQNDAFQAVIGEQVGLIKSIAQEHLSQVEGMVMRSVQEGRDLGTLTKDLQRRFGITKRRAKRIAFTQNQMATAALTRTRQKELGIRQARWLHSAGGKQPRPEHVAFSGKLYDVDKGAFLEGKWTWPGREINCRCVSIPVIPGFDD